MENEERRVTGVFLIPDSVTNRTGCSVINGGNELVISVLLLLDTYS